MSDDLDAWEKQAAQMLPAWMAFDFRLMYVFFQEKGLLATPADIKRMTKLLGHPARSFEDFAAETAKDVERLIRRRRQTKTLAA